MNERAKRLRELRALESIAEDLKAIREKLGIGDEAGAGPDEDADGESESEGQGSADAGQDAATNPTPRASRPPRGGR